MEKVSIVDDEFGIIGDIQFLKPSNPDFNNVMLKVLRIHSTSCGEVGSDLIMFHKRGYTWRLSHNHCYINLSSDFVDFYSKQINIAQNMTYEDFLCQLTNFRADNIRKKKC